MSYKLKIPQGWKEWGGYLLGIKFLIDFGKWLFNNRGSSKETQKEFAIMKKDNGEQFKKLGALIEKNADKYDTLKDDVREIFKEETKHFITKELFEERMKRQKEEIKHEMDVTVVKMNATMEEAKRIYNEAKIEHRNGKRRNEEIFLKISERLNEKI